MERGISLSVQEFRQHLLSMRRGIQERLAVLPLAYSTDGATFGYEASLTHAIPVGGYVRLLAGETEYLGQVITKDVATREGPQISLQGDAGLGAALVEGANVSETSFRVRIQHLQGAGALLGKLAGNGLEPLTSSDVFSDAEITSASAESVDQYQAIHSSGRAMLDIGRLVYGGGQVRARINGAGFDRHTLLCGQSGSGKTFSLGVLLERLLLETDLRMLIIDPNSDFVHLSEPGATTTQNNPLWGRFEHRTAGIRVLRPVKQGQRVPNALRIRLSDLNRIEQGLALQLDPLESPEEFNAFWTMVDRIGRDQFGLADVKDAAARDLSTTARQIGLRIENLGLADWEIWCEGDEPSLIEVLERDWRALVLDIGGLSDQAEKSAIAMAVLGHLWRQRESRRPVLLVIDEAHNVCPQEPIDPLQSAATEHAIRIAGEGRKFGIYMLLATQRPQKLHANVVSQCDNLVLMRINSAADIAHLASAFSFVAPSLINQASQFTQGQSLIAGKIVPSPVFARFEGRLSLEGGGDVPADWAKSNADPNSD